MGKKIRVLLVFISLSLTLCIMSNTYSRYIASTTGNLEVLFAKWQILINDTDITNNVNSKITMAPVMIANSNIASNAIAPSSEGYFDININPTNVDVSFNYNISLAIANENMPDLLITKYAILPSDYVEGNSLTYSPITNNQIAGTMNYNNSVTDFSYSEFTIRIYFQWYEGTDEQMNDTADSSIGADAAINDTKFQVSADITFEQNVTATATE